MFAVTGRPSSAAVPPPDTSTHEHEGAYLRFDAGYGYTTFSGAHAPGSRLGAGSTELVAIAVGGALRNVIAYGTVELEAVRLFAPGTYSTSMVSLGPGAAYFVDPLNLYLAAAVQFTELMSLATDDNVYGRGVRLEAMVGEHLSLSARWSLGLAGRFFAATVSFPGARVTPLGIGLVASVMYN